MTMGPNVTGALDEDLGTCCSRMTALADVAMRRYLTVMIPSGRQTPVAVALGR